MTHIALILAAPTFCLCATACSGSESSARAPQAGSSECRIAAHTTRQAGLLDALYLDERARANTAARTESDAAGAPADGYGYEFEDDPLGPQTPVAGACDCLKDSLPQGTIHGCATVGERAHACLGSDGSDRLWRNQQCLPYKVNVDGNTSSLEYYLRGCTIPNDGELTLLSVSDPPRPGRFAQ